MSPIRLLIVDLSIILCTVALNSDYMCIEARSVMPLLAKSSALMVKNLAENYHNNNFQKKRKVGHTPIVQSSRTAYNRKDMEIVPKEVIFPALFSR